ncbi:hypothetical protein AUJ66_08905 [Candidatus Desantisbacteria bacterium CG1_02_38_46]|uniref:DUF624 domain-containing protein n=3 Tax=unclassified Candidatus Desantisiibacteriota TaxID=3106372 RepID=A0A2H9PB79_9BACT|nr:MAG: hypothetical protein AUJ66_08905 [Candidatus Desantisbacteria bacterium CG1_02_38_46]PIU51664.1 MAG: hypothetical protein COS91_03335 [Candidatus Desantisbacteria bacterium CG07_land_8_20_14_0_80_39_15]PIZ15976.1 MAG: hypothetical protein COY51_03875 [Candidatus Desantisbacteria bacterium CG_4_10_14_0_8_um_filter_39_17]
MSDEEKTENKVESISLVDETLKKFSQGLLNNLGKLILINLLWFIFAIPLFMLLFTKSRMDSSNFFALLFPFLILPAPATASIFNLTFQIIEGKDVKVIRDFFGGIGKYLVKGILLSAVIIMLFTAGFLYIWFCTNLKLSGVLPIVLIAIGLWIIFFIALMQSYLFPQMIQRNLNIKKILANSIYLTFDNVGFNSVIFLIAVVTWLVFGLSGIGIIILFMSAPSFLYNLAFKILLEKNYGVGGEIFKKRR